MRLFLVAAAFVGIIVPTIATAQVNVRSTVRRDGTYVSGHVRTTPNKSVYDNYSTKPNFNPNTGKSGTVDPYRPKPYKPYKAPHF